MLGHNGAGKTTTISMLTGLIGRTSGTAKVYEKDMFEETDEVREFLGVCPQHDVLFDLLTPREHLDIFFDFKGGDPAQKEAEIEMMIQDSGLNVDKDKISCTLSGGNKRKTSVCMALIGGSKLVILDEPTSGMDLGARRNLWDMLKKHKRDRIIILTTHYMDEADVLGDRIGIMAKGNLMCLGSSLFLKNRFGVGYKITLVKKRKRAHPELTNFLTTHFRGVMKSGEVAGEVSYVIPRDQASNFKNFFEILDNRLDDYDVKSYGVSMTSLEEVFLNINEELVEPNALKKSGKKKGETVVQTGVVNQSNEASMDRVNATKNTTMGMDTKIDQDYPSYLNSSGGNSSMESDEGDDEENMVRGSGCGPTVGASVVKRWNIYKRDYVGFIC